MTQPQRIDVRTIDLPKTDWNEVERRQKRTEELLDRMREAQRRLERAVERATQKPE